jgi:hypothetical protein
VADLLLLRLRAQSGDEEEIVAAGDYERLLSDRGRPGTIRKESACSIDSISTQLVDFSRSHATPIGLIVEYTAPRASASTLGYMCGRLKSALEVVVVDFVLISVPSARELDETGMLPHLGTTGVFVADQDEAFSVSNGALTFLSSASLLRSKRPEPVRPANIQDLRVRFGHFAAVVDGRDLHTNLLPDLESTEADRHAWRRVVRSTMDALVGIDPRTAHFVPIGWTGGELTRLALEVVDGDLSRVVQIGQRTADPHRLHVTLSAASLPAALHRRIALSRGVDPGAPIDHVNVFGSPGAGRSVVEVPDLVWARERWACEYCDDDVPIEGSGYDRLAASFHPRLFWDFLGWDQRQTLTGHWRSPTTPNHFNLKIESKFVFENFAESLAERMVNALGRAGVLPEWIGGLICTTGDERERLAPALARRLGVDALSTVAIDHSVRAAASRPGVDSQLRAWAEAHPELTSALEGENVVLLDQAAHHLSTLSALRKVAAVLSARPLAFAVFVDRTGFAGEHADALYHGLHFVPLYSWDSPPWRAFECPCRTPAKLHV